MKNCLKEQKGFLQISVRRKHMKIRRFCYPRMAQCFGHVLDTVKGIGVEQFWDSGVQKNCAVSVIEIKDGIAKVIEEGVIYYDDEVEDW